MRIIILILIIMFFTCTQASAQSTNSRELKLLSWNTYMLPAIPMFTHQKKRANGMVEVLNEGHYDIICFQEAYHKGFRKIILNGLKEQYPYQIIAKDKKLSLRPASGLWIISKQPIDKIKQIEFTDKYGLEGRTKKGAILFKMDGLNNFYFIVTHMQSADGVKRTAVRKSQSKQIYTELVEPYIHQNATFLFAGDWNMEEGSDFDNSSLRTLFNITHPKTMPTESTWPSAAFSKNSKKYLLDLIMLSYPNNKVTDFKTSIPNLQYEWKKGKHDLSDHLPIDVQFLLKGM